MGTVVLGVGKRRQWLRAAACCLVMGALASCGSEGKIYEGMVERTPAEPPKPADEVRGDRLSVEAMELLKNAETLRIGVEMTAPGKHQKISVHMDRHSKCTGTFDGGPAKKGDLIMLGADQAYFRFSDDALDAIRAQGVRLGPEAAARSRERTALARGKYLKIPNERRAPSGASPTQMCDLNTALGKLDGGSVSDLSGSRALPEKRWHGQRVTPLVEKDGGNDMTVYLAVGDKPYIVGMTQTRGDEHMVMEMSDYDKPVAVRAPDPSLVIDLADIGLGGGGGALFAV
ncbi:hypothetical protein [Streptomyces sp. MZ04]|uniref:hypothetical protein n=1 Tax=Streptomyces sp. MZ04 TaxID=2559236 RepID=UPI00107EA506|nr:hypothetical protein [Streptomyces sp. MZ04]TGB00057.1 hypothetical protein E2651_29205 [Streptomyces sp. MZ04]